jgi:hypothetical protein
MVTTVPTTTVAGGIEPERRYGRLAGSAALASVATLCGALVVANASAGHRRAPIGASSIPDSKLSRLHELQDFHAGVSGQAVAVALRCAALAMSVAVGLFLFWLIRRRGGVVGRVMLVSIVAGPILVSAATVFGYFALKDVVDAFYASGPRTAARASQLIDDAGRLKVAGVLDFTSRAVFAVWVGLASARMMRLGFLTTFLGYFGIAGAFALVVLPIGDAMYIGWLASIGFLAWGWWPTGRPEAWSDVAATGKPAGL